MHLFSLFNVSISITDIHIDNRPKVYKFLQIFYEAIMFYSILSIIKLIHFFTQKRIKNLFLRN